MSANKINLLEKSKIVFKKRVLGNIFDFGFMSLLFFAIISLYKALIVPLLVVLFFLVFYSLKRYLESKVYINNIHLESNVLVIEYFLRDEIITKEIAVENFKVDFIDSVIGNFVKSSLVFYDKDQVVLKQFNVGDWSRQSLKEFKGELEEHLNTQL